MQIQRLQNLWLLIAFICMGISMFLPWGYIDYDSTLPLRGIDRTFATIPGSLASILALAGIILYRNLRRQRLVCLLSAIFAILSVILMGIVYWRSLDSLCVPLQPSFGAIPMIIGAVFALLARNRVIHDEKLLRSADRIR